MVALLLFAKAQVPPQPSLEARARLEAMSADAGSRWTQDDLLRMADVIGTFRVIAHECTALGCADSFEVEAIDIDSATVRGERFTVHVRPSACYSAGLTDLNGATVFLSAVEAEDGSLLQIDEGLYVKDGAFVRSSTGFDVASDVGTGWEPIGSSFTKPNRRKPPRAEWTTVTRTLATRARVLR